MILGIGLALGDKARGPGPQDAAGERLFIVRRVDEDLDGRPPRLDVVDQLDAVLAVQGKVDDDDVRATALDRSQRSSICSASPQTSRSGSRPIAKASERERGKCGRIGRFGASCLMFLRKCPRKA